LILDGHLVTASRGWSCQVPLENCSVFNTCLVDKHFELSSRDFVHVELGLKAGKGVVHEVLDSGQKVGGEVVVRQLGVEQDRGQDGGGSQVQEQFRDQLGVGPGKKTRLRKIKTLHSNHHPHFVTILHLSKYLKIYTWEKN
jgi:hypothetical protein